VRRSVSLLRSGSLSRQGHYFQVGGRAHRAGGCADAGTDAVVIASLMLLTATSVSAICGDVWIGLSTANLDAGTAFTLGVNM
jgi:hypothetical protein